MAESGLTSVSRGKSGPTPAQIALGITGMLIGAALGCAAFAALLYFFGLYAIMLVGLGTGMGCNLLSRSSSKWLGVGCAVVGLIATLLIDWSRGPSFIEDDSLLFYLRHLHQLSSIQLIMIVLGVVMAFYVGKGRG